tara:strand:- start:304 stop:957 length:654 start_codon:yes stop_codon:yes gene_type:complete
MIGDHDPCLAYLARAAWDAAATPEAVYRDQIRSVCGSTCVDDMLEVFRKLESTTLTLEGRGLGLTFPVPGMFRKHMHAGAIPGWLKEVREGYRRALAAAQRAQEKCPARGRSYVDYWVGRLEFGVGYIDCMEAAKLTANAEAAAKKANKAGDTALAKKHLQEAARRAEKALQISRDMLESFARVAGDQSDRGAIATMAEEAYRPLKAKRNSLRKQNQ